MATEHIETRSSSLWETIKKAEGSFWFLRGVFAACAVVAAIPNLTVFSRWQFLKAFEYFALNWKAAFQWLSDLLRNIPLLPHIPPIILHGLAFVMAIGIPASFSILKHGTPLLGPIHELLKKFKYSNVTYKLTTAAIVLSVTFGLGVLLYEIGNRNKALEVIEYVTEWPANALFNRHILFKMLLLYEIVFFIGISIFALAKLKGYFRGLIFVITALLALQILYWLNAPGISQWIDAAVPDRSSAY